MKIIASGDIALCRGVEQKILKGEESLIAQELRTTLKSADIFLANVECPLTDSSRPKWDYFPTLKAGYSSGKFLGELGVDVASLANNHIADYDKKGLADTISVLEEQGISWLGAGWSPEQAGEPLIVEINLIRLGILSLAQPEISAARDGMWGAGVLEEDFALSKMKELAGKVDIAVAYLHFGVEFFEYPTPSQVRLSRALIDAGARLVIGHHPHVPQGFEYYKDGFIAYSLGNFIFDMPRGPHKFSRLGLLIQADFNNRKLEKIEVIPFESSMGDPALLSGSEREEALKYLDEISSVIQDEKELIKSYYFTCKGNFNIFIKALLYYGLKRMNLRRIRDIVISQLWPQLLSMRRDLILFLLSGAALKFEKMKNPTAAGSGAKLWRYMCRFMSFLGLGWGKIFLKKYIRIDREI
jgi:hypothetical protein